MKIESNSIELIDVDSIIANPKNANKHPKEQIEKLEKLIKYQGFRNPLVISKRSGFLVAGHGRLEAAKNLGMKTVPVIHQEFENEAQEYAYVISDNEIARWATLDNELVLKEIELLDLDIEMLAIKDFKLPEIEVIPKTDEDEVPEVKEVVTKRGDIWLLGEHRVMCGDSTMIDDVEKLMKGNKVDITFTSPPYNIGKSIRGNMYGDNDDNKTSDEYTNFLSDWTDLALTFTDFVFHNNQMLESNKKSLIEYQFKYIDQIKDILIWNKKICPPHINKGTFNTKWEYVMCLSKDGKGRAFPCQWQGKYPNVIDTESNSGNEFAKSHKAGFPVSFPEWIISKMDFCKSVYDPFMGTGTTLIASDKLNKKSYGMELDATYCDLTINRWQNYTGKEVTLESTGETYNSLKAKLYGDL